MPIIDHGYKKRTFNWFPYIWLVYFPFSLLEYLPVKSARDFLWLAIGAVFLLAYIAVVESKRFERAGIVVELITSLAFLIFEGNFWIIIFPAWSIPYVLAKYPRKSFYKFAFVYYGLLLGKIGYTVIVQNTVFSLDSWISLFLPIVGPLISYFSALSVIRSRELYQDNRRLESIVRRGERERIARDLHDTLGQSFSMIAVKTELAKKLLDKQPEKVNEELDDILTTSRQNLQVVRNIVNNLHQMSIGETLISQSKNLRAAEIHLQTNGESKSNEWPTNIQTVISEIIQEAVTNVIRHSKANQVWIEFSDTTKLYKVEISDSGKARDYFREGSNGINGMKQRAESVGGSFSIGRSAIGTRLVIRIPKEN